MKPGLAVLPLEVWADVFLSPWFTREELAEIANKYNNRIGNREFVNKLQKLLHDCGKQSLRYLKIYKRTPKKQENPQRVAFLAVTNAIRRKLGCGWRPPTYEDRDFPETDMPENIKGFKQLEISHLDDDVLDFLNKIRSLFTNVFIRIETEQVQEMGNVGILCGHLIPMLVTIRAIRCYSNCMEWLEREFPRTLARAQELDVIVGNPVSIPFYLDWLNTPRQDHHNGPRFLMFYTNATTAAAMIDAVRKKFLDATSPATFVIFIRLALLDPTGQQYTLPDEFNIENTATNEQLVLRTAAFKRPPYCRMQGNIGYVEIMRHPTGADANVREWLNGRAYWETEHTGLDREERVITIKGKSLTIGPDNDKKDEDGYIEEFECGPSTSAKIMKKMVDKDNEEMK